MRASCCLRLAVPAVVATIALTLAACAQTGSDGSVEPASSSSTTAATTETGTESAGAAPTSTKTSATGRIAVTQWPELTIDGKPYRAAAGARVFNAGNLMVTPNQIPIGARVKAEFDGRGQVRTLRILEAR